MEKILRNSPNNIFVFLVIFCSALIIRIWFLARIQIDPAFHMPIIDPQEFNYMAVQILHNNWLWNAMPLHTPLYPYFLAVIYKLFGFNVNAVAFIQCLMGALSVCLMYFLTLRLANTMTAAVCAGFMAVYWFFIYTQVYLWSENLEMFLNIILICYLTFVKDSVWKFLLSGILLGLSSICRPDILFFAVTILWLIFGQNKERGRGFDFYGSFLIGLFIIMAPVLIRNHKISGDWVLRQEIGSNFYIGNNPNFHGTNIYIEPRMWQKFNAMPYGEMNSKRNLLRAMNMSPDQQILELKMNTGWLMSENEKNAFYLRKTWKTIKDHPFVWIGLISGKIFSVLTGREFLRSEDVYFRDLFVHQTFFNFFSTRIIFILAITGLFLSWKERDKFRLIYILLLSIFPSFLFPTKTRYLIPIMPFVIIFSSLAVSYLCQAIKSGNQRERIKIYGIVFFISMLSFINPLNVREPDVSETYYGIAQNSAQVKNYKLSEEYFLKTLELNPSNYSARNGLGKLWIERGILCISKGQYDQALEYFNRAKIIKSSFGAWEPFPFTLVGNGHDLPTQMYIKYFRYP